MEYEAFDKIYEQALLDAKEELINKSEHQDIEVDIIAGLYAGKQYNIHRLTTAEECDQAIKALKMFNFKAIDFISGTSPRNPKFKAYFTVSDIQLVACCTQNK